MNFKSIEAKNIIKAEHLERYAAEMRYFHDQLSVLHHNVYFLQHVADFPVDLFIHPMEDLFLHLSPTILWRCPSCKSRR